MFGVELLCSDETCAVTVDAVGDITQLGLLVCDDCGCTLEITAVWEVHDVRLAPRVEELSLAA